jgi:hypothetical protein
MNELAIAREDPGRDGCHTVGPWPIPMRSSSASSLIIEQRRLRLSAPR